MAPTPAPHHTPPTGKRAIYYHTSWSMYDRDYQVRDLPIDDITDIAYAFYNVDSDGTVRTGDPWSDHQNPLVGKGVEPQNVSQDLGNFGQFMKLRKAGKRFNFSLALGGWSWSGKFSDAVSTEATRGRMVQTIVDTFEQWPGLFNGVSIDWEYVSNDGVNYGMEGNIARKADARNLVAFVKALRKALGKGFTLSMCVTAAPEKIKMPVATLAKVLDEFHVMTYDFMDGKWGGTTTGHHTNLMPAEYCKYSVRDSVAAWKSRGVPAKKLFIGAALYSRGFANTDGMGKPCSGPSPDTSWDDGSLDYKKCPLSGATEHWDPVAHASYSYDPKTRVVNSYDCPRSVKEKCEFIFEEDLGGIIVWESSGDHPYTHHRSLMKVIHDNLTHKSSDPTPTPEENTGVVSLVTTYTEYGLNTPFQLHPPGQGLTTLDAQRFTVLGPQGTIKFNGPGVTSVRIRKHDGADPSSGGLWVSKPWHIVYRHGVIEMPPSGSSDGWSPSIVLEAGDQITVQNGMIGFTVAGQPDDVPQFWFDTLDLGTPGPTPACPVCGCTCPCHAPTPVPKPDPKPTPKPDPKPVPEPVPDSSTDTHIPADIAPQLRRLMDMSAGQCDTVLRLISLPENGNPTWWKHYNYIEDLDDGRGFTCTIFGACSGTGDMLMIFEEIKKLDPKHALVKYIPSLKKCKGGHIDPGCKSLPQAFKKLGTDPTWQRAVWKVYIDLYWTFAAAFASKTGSCAKRPGAVLTSATSKGFMVDTAINHGANLESLQPILKKMKNPRETDERMWILDFINTRRAILKSGWQDLDTSKSGDRALLWKALVESGNTTLARPIQAHRGYWGQYVIDV